MYTKVYQIIYNIRIVPKVLRFLYICAQSLSPWKDHKNVNQCKQTYGNRGKLNTVKIGRITY